MSVASRNPFQLLGDDGDDNNAPVAAKAPVKAPAAQQPPRNIPGAGQKSAPRASQAPRGARGGARAAVDPTADETKDSRGGRPRGEPRGRGRGRGGREGRGRAFDRHSQTDRVDSQKNLHQGWGGDDGKRELDNEKKAEADAKAEGTEANGAPAEAEPVAVEAEEEEKTLTLDEYLAAQAEKRANLGAPKPRETKTDDSAWSNFGVKVEKNTGDDYFAAKKTEKTRARTQKEGKQLLEIEQRFDPPPSSFRGRGGRGGPRGGRGGDRGSSRGGQRGRGGRGNNASVNLADQSAFPSLS